MNIRIDGFIENTIEEKRKERKTLRWFAIIQFTYFELDNILCDDNYRYVGTVVSVDVGVGDISIVINVGVYVHV